MPYTGGKRTLVIVHYARVLRLLHDQAPFHYFLRSYAQWDGPIGQERVHVVAAKGLHLAIPKSSHLKLAQHTAHEASWKLVQAQPTEDIHLSILRSKSCVCSRQMRRHSTRNSST